VVEACDEWGSHSRIVEPAGIKDDSSLSFETKDLIVTVFGHRICRKIPVLSVLRTEVQWKVQVRRALQNERGVYIQELFRNVRAPRGAASMFKSKDNKLLINRNEKECWDP
jgi:hypothetical protein